jgi:hypothetical protein
MLVYPKVTCANVFLANGSSWQMGFVVSTYVTGCIAHAFGEILHFRNISMFFLLAIL